VKLILARSRQAKGRVERMNGKLREVLVKALGHFQRWLAGGWAASLAGSGAKGLR